MQADVKTSSKESEPINLLYLMDETVLKNLLNGHSFAISAALSVLFKKVVEISSIEQIGRINALAEKAEDVFYPLCKYFRSDCDCERVCQEFDREITLRYYTGDLSGPRLYRCPLQLWDMTYPLYIEGNLLGVLFAGQVVVKEDAVNWPEVLETIKDQIIWGNFTEFGNQVEDIYNAIEEMDLGIEQKIQAKAIINEESNENGMNVSAETLLKRYKDFLEFGQMMEALLRRLYELTHLSRNA
jgi:ligand-binding sensor protein